MKDPNGAIRRFCPLAVLVAAGVAANPRLLSAHELPAELLLKGGAVYTLDAARSWAQAVAVRDGRIVYVGSDAGAAHYTGPETRVVELGGRMLLPGFQDAHVHPVSGGLELTQCNLNDLETQQAVLDKVEECARDRSKPWVVGGGWLLPVFPGGSPTKEALDRLVPDRPAYLSASDGHTAWVNSKALALARVTAATRDPANGRIERNSKTGEPSGTLRESAMDLVADLLPKPTPADRSEGLRRALAYFNSIGITAVQEASAGTGAEGGGARDTLSAYREAERRGELSVRVVAALGTDPKRGPEQVDELVALRREFTSARVQPTAAKIFADGVVEPRTAAMLEPYVDRPGESGTPNFPPEQLNALVARLAREEFSVHIHAIGDRAVRISLDALEAAGARAGGRGPRHQIAHLEFIHPQDAPRFRTLGVIANFQPLWAYADSYITDMTLNGVTASAARYIYPIASVVRAGGPLAFGSDWSVSSANPLEGIQTAVTRQGLDGKPEPFLPGEAIDLATGLAAYTIGAACANGLDDETGSIEVGKAADIVVLSENVFALPPDRIATARVLLTLLDGKPVYRDPGFVVLVDPPSLPLPHAARRGAQTTAASR
jgi:predicted amidohydrolase YtcJ